MAGSEHPVGKPFDVQGVDSTGKHLLWIQANSTAVRRVYPGAMATHNRPRLGWMVSRQQADSSNFEV
jgi:hypothetical protein